MPPSTATPTPAHHRRREEARESLLKTALELAAEAPFTTLTVEQIAAGAGISRSAFYLHFRDKGDLLETALAEVAGEIEVTAARWWRGEGAPAQRIRLAVEAFVAVYTEHGAVLRVATDVSAHDERVREQWLGLIGRFTDSAAEHLASEQRRGLVPDRLDAGAAAEALVWMAERCCYVYLEHGSDHGRGADEVAEQIASVWAAALYPGVVPAEELAPGSTGAHLWGVPAPKFD